MKAFQACLRGTIVVRSAGRPTLVPGFLMTRALYFATSSDVGKTGTWGNWGIHACFWNLNIFWTMMFNLMPNKASLVGWIVVDFEI